MDHRLSQSAGIVLHPYGLLGLIHIKPSNTVNLSHLRHRQRSGFSWRNTVTVKNIKLCHRFDDTSDKNPEPPLSLEPREITRNLRARPVLSAHKLSPQNTLPIYDISLRNLRRSIKSVYTLIRVANRHKVNMILCQKSMVGIRILINAYRNNHQVRHLPLQRQQTGQLFNAGSAKARPQIQHHNLAPELIQINRSEPVADDKLRRWLAQIIRVASPVASRQQQNSQRNACPHSTHNNLHFL